MKKLMLLLAIFAAASSVAVLVGELSDVNSVPDEEEQDSLPDYLGV